MHGRFQRAHLAPRALVVVAMQSVGADEFKASMCPRSDLPLAVRRVVPTILARRFWCRTAACGRCNSCQQLDAGVLARFAPHIQRRETIVHRLGFSRAQPCVEFANRPMIAVTKGTFPRVVGRRSFSVGVFRIGDVSAFADLPGHPLLKITSLCLQIVA